jgi:hypothetical protein
MELQPRDPKSPLDIDIDNIAYNETYEEDLEYYGLTEIIDPNEDEDAKWNVIWADEDEFPEWEDESEDLPDDLFAD